VFLQSCPLRVLLVAGRREGENQYSIVLSAPWNFADVKKLVVTARHDTILLLVISFSALVFLAWRLSIELNGKDATSQSGKRDSILNSFIFQLRVGRRRPNGDIGVSSYENVEDMIGWTLRRKDDEEKGESEGEGPTLERNEFCSRS